MSHSLAQESYPQLRLKQIEGVGTLIAVTFLPTLEDPNRFGKSRDVGGYLGLQPGPQQRDRAIRRCISARKAIPICERCLCKEHNTFWDSSGSTISGDGD